MSFACLLIILLDKGMFWYELVENHEYRMPLGGLFYF